MKEYSIKFHSLIMAELKDSVITLRVVSWTLGSIIICMSASRIWVRFNLVKQPSWDDLFNVLATVRPQVLRLMNIQPGS